MVATNHLRLSLLAVLFSLSLLGFMASAADLASDTISRGRNITDGNKLVSANGVFTLGFFGYGVPMTRRYLGIWFTVSVPPEAVCWVANRDRPLADTSGVLTVTDAGSLLLLDGSGDVVWSSNTTGAAAPATAQLLWSGNLVVTDPSSGAYLWQSFDHPSNTLLPGMKVGRNLWTNGVWNLTSWRSDKDDPSPGSYQYATDTRGVPENVVWEEGGRREIYRTGPWNGLRFSGISEMKSYSNMFAFELTSSRGEITYSFVAKPGAPLSRLLLTDKGVIQRLVWVDGEWRQFFQGPEGDCDRYGRCGAFGLCDPGATSTLPCGCVKGFSPVSPVAWSMRNTSAGCRRNVPLHCAGDGKTTTTDGFVTVRGVKLPDTAGALVNATLTLDECRERCRANCSCVAYAPLDIRGGGAGSGCIMWTDKLIDIRYVDGGQDLYLRAAKSELEKGKLAHRRLIIGASVASVVILLVVLFVLLMIRRRRRSRNLAANSIHSSHASTVPSVELASVKEATGNFSEGNIIGQGGFSIVYEGNLPDGRKVAVKRLRHPFLADKSGEDFMREVEVMSRLRHGNLVQLLSYCKEMNERVLIYEFMQNKSLNLYIFGEDPKLRALLNWERRLEIIRGIAKGVAYLHEGLCEEVIHRDLKPCNILLDDNWRPKIADFGTAKLFFDDQATDPTLVQSAGYTAPEYAAQGHLTLKCDVYSFGVVLLEIVCGQRNRTTPTLLSDAWESWNQCTIKDLLDSVVSQPEPELLSELERCVQIGLLCVQQSPDDRPTMPAVVAMLNSNTSQIKPPKRLEFATRTRSHLDKQHVSMQEVSCPHNTTVDLA
ncbi:hypothetical protein ACP70R_010888 [Stipagrostis hirtigluma subsp. patula]